MNEEIILSMVEPYVKDGAITYDEFENIFDILSRKEQYDVVDILYANGINLIDQHITDEDVILDTELLISEDDDNIETLEENDFEKLYDDDIFRDKNSIGSDVLVINKEIHQSNEILCALIQQGNRQAVQDLCIKNKLLVDKYVLAYQKLYGNRLEFEDLEQVGFLGLIKAAQKFEIEQGNAFSTYAVFWIKQCISREIMDNGFAIRIPVHMMERINKVLSLDSRLIYENVEDILVRIQMIGEELELEEAQVRECFVLRNNYLSYTSLDLPIGEEEDSLMGDFIPDEESESVEEQVFHNILGNQLEELLETLKEREKVILKYRFGLDDGCPRTLEEIGEIFGVTRERIRQIEAKAIRKLRHPSRSKKIEGFL